MTKLKTLKNLECLDADHPRLCINDHTYSGKQIKQEAIKWVKEIFRTEEENGNIIKGSKNNQSRMNPRKQGKISWIRHFFNITEEELK